VLGFSLFNFALYGALNFTSALNVSIEQSAFPSVVMLLMFIIYRERISALQGLGVLLSVVGILITVSQGSVERLMALEFNIGDVIMMAGVFVYSLYSILLRYKPQLPWHMFMLLMAIGATVTAFPLAVWEVSQGVYPQASWKVPALLAYIVIFPSLLSQVFWVRGVELIGPSRASVFINLVPVFGSGLAVVIIGEAFASYHAAGIVFVVSGVMLAEWAGKRRAARIAAKPRLSPFPNSATDTPWRSSTSTIRQ
jgi:drug/metabolite transporter (DMT)-like permease